MEYRIRDICKFPDSDKEFDCDMTDIYKDKELTIEIYNSGNKDYEFKYYYEIIHIEKGSTFFTLFGCKFISRNNIKATYKVEGFFEGIFINNLEDIKVRSYSIYLPKYLNYIFESNSFIDDLNFSFEKTYNISDNLSIQYNSFINEFKLEDYSLFNRLFISLEFIYKEVVDLEIVYNDLNILKQFFDFNSGIGNYLKPVSMKIENNENFKLGKRIQYNFPKLDIFPLLVYNSRFSINVIDDEDVLSRKNHNAFLNFSDSKEDIFKIIKKWYENEKYRVVYQYYIDCHDWLQGSNRLITNVMFNNKFLNVIQSLEVYHTIKYGDKKNNEKFEKNFTASLNKVRDVLKEDKILQSWLTKKMKGLNKEKTDFTLLERINQIKDSCNLLNDIEIVDFSHKSKEIRDSLSHGDIKNVFQGEELDIYYNYSLLLLLFSIFKTLEISEEKLGRIFENNFQVFSKKNIIKQKLKLLN